MPADNDTLIAYGAFRQAPTRLFLDYLGGTGAAGGFLGGGKYDLDDLAARAVRQRTPESAAVYKQVADVLRRQQLAFGGSAASAALAGRLAEPGAAVVATGQQAGLFGGPLYVAYKALAAQKVAQAVAAKSGRAVIPVFWIASDDHDFAEIRTVSVLDEAGQIRSVRYSPRREPAGLPASRIVLDDNIGAALGELRDALPPSVHRDEWLEKLRVAYAPGTSMSTAFARLMTSLFPGMVVLDPSDPALKPLMVPVLRRELAEGSPSSRLAIETTAKLKAAGYHQQVPVRDGFLNLFLFEDGARRALGSQNGHVEVRGIGRRLEMNEALARLEREPAAWSPGALLRPLAQDFMLPTIAYIGGPAEIAYHAQIGPSYAHFGIERPALIPRPSFTLVESAAGRTLENEGLRVTDLQGDLETLFGRWTEESYPEVEAAFSGARDALSREMKKVEETLAALDPTLRAATDSALGRALHPLGVLHEKATRALKKKDQARADRLRRTRDQLFPGGVLQERGLGLIGMVARHGTGALAEVARRMDPWAHGHQVLSL